MFTGLITDVGRVSHIEERKKGRRIALTHSYDLQTIAIGASIACDGCCLTVVEKLDDILFFDVSQESLSKTLIGDWDMNRSVNLERSLKAGDELGGHIVSGHVDGLAKCVSIQKDGESHILKIKAPDGYAAMLAPKGSAALNGVSLTVNTVEDQNNACFFTVNIIPHTWDVTNLGRLQEGDYLHFEADLFARYVDRYLARQTALNGKA